MPSEQYRRSTRTTASGGRLCPREAYPATVAECVEERTYRPEAMRALRIFRIAKPWRGTWDERGQKIAALHRALCDAYGLTTQLVREQEQRDVCSGASSYCAGTNTITLRGRLSVVTYLHEFAHALGYGEQGACRWSINLFRRVFPRSYARLRHEGHTLVR